MLSRLIGERYFVSYCEMIIQIVTFFEKICCAAPGRSYMYNISGSWLNKITYNYWLKMQVGFHLSCEVDYWLF